MEIKTETPRLYFRELLPEDAQGLFELDSNPMVHQYLGNNPIKNISECHDIILFIRKQYLENGIGRWAMIRKEDDTFLGWCGIKKINESLHGKAFHHDLGYRLIQKFWNKGYASEGAKACADYAFNTMKLSELYASVHPENLASNKIILNCGFKFLEDYVYENIPHKRYVKYNSTPG